jgi:hypothetical protein
LGCIGVRHIRLTALQGSVTAFETELALVHGSNVAGGTRGPMPRRFAIEGFKFSLNLIVTFCAVVFFGSSDHSWLEQAVERWRYVQYPVNEESTLTSAEITRRVFKQPKTGAAEDHRK